jgi:hypothetical protein
VAKGVRHLCMVGELGEFLFRKTERPSPSDELRRRNTPLTKRVRLPRANTNGMTVNLVSEGEKTQ